MRKLLLFGFFQLLLFTSYAQSTSGKHRTSQFNVESHHLAIQGYDPVAYFTDQKAVKGRSGFTYNYDGILYRFTSQANLEKFKSQPAKYEPQYGGWCAYAMGSDGQKVEIDPETFKITNGKLYLFYNKFFNNTLKSWNKNENILQKKADDNWMKFYHL